MRKVCLKYYITIIALLAFTFQFFGVDGLSCKEMKPKDITVVQGTVNLGLVTRQHHVDRTTSIGIAKVDSHICCSQVECTQMDCNYTKVAVLSTVKTFLAKLSYMPNLENTISFQTQERTSLFRPPISQ